MTVNINDAKRIRILIALTALKHKPKDVSIADLRDQFPLSGNRNEGNENGSWRDRALKLEEEVNELKRKYNEELAELNALRELSRPESNASKAKKKKKLNPAVESRIASDTSATSSRSFGASEDLRTVTAPELSSPLNLYDSYHRLFQLSSSISSKSSHSMHRQLVLSATSVLQALASSLQTAFDPQGSTKITLTFVNGFNTILCSTLSRAMILLSSLKPNTGKKRPGSAALKVNLDKFFTVLACDIVVPIIKSFSRLSENALLPILSTGRGKRRRGAGSDTSGADGMMCGTTLQGLLAILRDILAFLSASKHDETLQLLDLMKASLISEIERLFIPDGTTLTIEVSPFIISAATVSTEESKTQLVAKLSRKDRIHLLARKNALWYLCAIAQDVFSTTTATRAKGSTPGPVREKADIILSRLMIRCSGATSPESGLGPRGVGKMSDTERAMIHSVIEKIWLAE
ncbi:uncharacterized protein FOMMEDRAFT_155596 [Fomitiporia mediterranea MF3/22]|uniref:uncharacterized protein n=1 Tax=Fomitiporia mediterranea (strain MF3/22) TaxID=694068 RepID=UPI00044093DC|nr:uncharacterized protein FOMMEDRAFT_155596 [Fomitiporia mediterranea MF3/22]EJD04465.1 hypothetical protein FOMMEDRAFT_155596 [Fomitiporia mediterranea MF3/22]